MGTVPRPGLQSGPSFPDAHSQRRPPPPPATTYPSSPFPLGNWSLMARGRDREVSRSHLLAGPAPTMGCPLCVGQLVGWGPWPGTTCIPCHPPPVPCSPSGDWSLPVGERAQQVVSMPHSDWSRLFCSFCR
uniref:Uncharacterized protein n=1 Tax=Myotis myotis TaxID=51298 RepID=A0A7J7ZWR6_MYOMY|nr:hypothetical protein mMyoMyo1_009669 [Myotis myotis]